MLTIACVWVRSEVYGTPEWVHRLYRMVTNHIGAGDLPGNEYRFLCVTPHWEEFKGQKEILAVPPVLVPPPGLPKWWYKLNLFELPGERVLYFDLDVVITAPVRDLVNFPSDFVVAPSSGVPMRGHDFNSSVMAWNPEGQQAKFIRDAIKKGVPYFRFAGDQQWLSSLPIRVDLYPSRWVKKYLPKGGVQPPAPGTIVTLLTQGGKNQALIDAGHTWIAEYWR